MKITVKTTGKQPRAFYRAGLKFTEQARELEVVDEVEDAETQITNAQFKLLKAEQQLQVSIEKGEKKLDENVDPLDAMNQKQLREEADKRELKYGNNDSKDKLREMIREDDKKAAAAKGAGAGE